MNFLGTVEKDILSKRVEFIDDQSVDIRETFGFASPAEVLKAVKLYTAVLLELGSGEIPA